MGKPDFSKKINIIHIVEFILAVVVACCMADNICLHCGKHFIQNQVVDATAFGVLMFISVIFLGMFLEEEVGPKSDLCYSFLGGVMSVISGILVLLFASKNSDYMEDHQYYRLLAGGTCFVLNGAVFLVEFFLLIFKKEKIDAD